MSETNCRPLVMPGAGPTSGLWFACVRYLTIGGNRGTRALGGYGTTWVRAAAQALAECRRLDA
jgi:hypothetical protein